MLADQFRDHAVILRNLNLLMIDVKHESRYNYTELLYLMDEAFFMGAFFDWLLPNSNGIITVIVILAVAIPSLTVVRRLTKGHVSKNSCTVQTVGFIRSTRQTGLYVNENPQLLFELDALAEDGTIFQASVRKIIPITEIAVWFPAGRSPSAIIRTTGPGQSGTIIRTRRWRRNAPPAISAGSTRAIFPIFNFGVLFCLARLSAAVRKCKTVKSRYTRVLLPSFLFVPIADLFMILSSLSCGRFPVRTFKTGRLFS